MDFSFYKESAESETRDIQRRRNNSNPDLVPLPSPRSVSILLSEWLTIMAIIALYYSCYFMISPMYNIIYTLPSHRLSTISLMHYMHYIHHNAINIYRWLVYYADCRPVSKEQQSKCLIANRTHVFKSWPQHRTQKGCVSLINLFRDGRRI